MNKLINETTKLLYQYFEAAGNLYGIIPLYKLLQIYNSHNDPISEEDFLDFVDNMDLNDKYYDIFGKEKMYDDIEPVKPICRDVVAEYLYYDEDAYYELEQKQFGIPYYIPEKEKFLKYADELYFEKTLEYISLRTFLRNQSYLSKEQADTIAEDIQLLTLLNDDNDIEIIAHDAMRLGLKLNSSNSGEFSRLWYDVDRNTRKHIYCGHTYNEIF